MKQFFPWRLFRWFVSRQILLLLLGPALVFLGLWLTIPQAEVGLFSATEALTLVGVALVCVVLFYSLITGLMAYRLVVPLGRIIEKARVLREVRTSGTEQSAVETQTTDEPGEWYELERAVNRLGRDLHSKTIRLSREKTELRAIMSAVSEAVLAISNERRVLFYNAQFAEFFKPMSIEEEDVRISQVIREPDVIDMYDKVLRTGDTRRGEVQITLRGERLPRILELSVAPLKKKHNQEVYGAVGIFHDITELKRAERIRIDFVGNVSHELRTPLTTISGYLQTLQSDLKRGHLDQAQEFLTIASNNVSRLKDLVEDLLDLSALESGKDMSFTEFSVRDLTESVLKQVNVLDHKVTVKYDFLNLRADERRVEQVLRNLMENAVRYVPSGGHIEVWWGHSKDSVFELHVKDNGPGIPEQHHARLFERFYRLDSGRSRDKGGTGIGLALVKHIMQRHGGRVYLQSHVGKGSEFICEFPSL